MKVTIVLTILFINSVFSYYVPYNNLRFKTILNNQNDDINDIVDLSQSTEPSQSIIASNTNLKDTFELSLKSPSKVNLFLRILGRRPNGYHDLASLFQAISLSDDMNFSKLPYGIIKDELVCSDKSLAIDESNLVIKALDLMRRKTGINQYFRVSLNKNVPIQAGLGGGSGNAATAMHAFNVLTDYPATLENLIEWSAEIGSDITFFFSTGTAYCTGRGEIIEPLDALPNQDKCFIHLFKPKQGLSTALVFKTLNLENLSKVSPTQLLDIYKNSGPLFASSIGGLVNDLESPAFSNEPILQNIKNDIINYNYEKLTGVMMSGSGTSIYGISEFEDINTTEFLSKYPDLQYYKCKFINKPNDSKHWY